MKVINKIKPLSIIFLYFFLSQGHALAWNPPAGTPLGDKVHPRIWLIPEESPYTNFGIKVSDITDRIATNSIYKEKFQSWINTMDGRWSSSTTGATVIDSTTNAIGFAFLYQTDPANISGITASHTQNDYGQKALEWGRYVATQMRDSGWFDYSTTYYNGEASGPRNMSIAIVADWVSDLMTTSDRQLFINATLEAIDNASQTDTLSTGAHWAGLQNGMAAIGIYGDTVDDVGSGTTYATHMTTLINLFNTNWLEGTAELTEQFFSGGSTDIQGIDYFQIHFNFGTNMFLAMSSCLNNNYYETMSYLKYMPYQYVYKTDPRTQDGFYPWFLSNDSAPSTRYLGSHWGLDNIHLNTTMYALVDNYPNIAGILKGWTEDHNRFQSSTKTSDWVVAELLFSPYMKDVSSVHPSGVLPLSQHIGMGRYVFKTAFDDPDETTIIFNARPYHVNDGGHASRDFGHFMIAKYGLATGRRTNSKSPSGWSGNILDTQLSFFYNTMAVSSGSNDPLGSFKSGYSDHDIDPTSPIWQPGGSNYIGRVAAEDIDNGSYDYVDYDYTEAWEQSKVDYAEREFLYLRSEGGGDDEYIVVFDRINSIDASYDKYFLLGIPFTAKLLDNAGAEILMTAESCPGDSTPGGRWIHTNASPEQDNTLELINTWSDPQPANHSKLFNRTLWPENFQINKQGGDWHSHEDLNCNPVTWKTSYPAADYEKNYYGSYVMQIQSTTNQNYDIFLNVMQVGDSNSMNRMTPIDRISSSLMVGAHIKDSTLNRVVLFSSLQDSKVPTGTTISYSTIPTTTSTKHYLFGLQPNSPYTIVANGEPNSLNSNSAGVIVFGTGDLLLSPSPTISILDITIQ